MRLEDEQYELLGKFVETHLSTPPESRGTFIATWPHNDQQATFFHSRVQSLRFQGNLSDAVVLARAGLLLQSPGAGNSSTFSVLPEGIDVHQKRGASGGTNGGGMRLFISHSSRDRIFVTALVDLLRSALNLATSDIRCTSLAGFNLPGGADIASQLKREVLEAHAFIAVVSRSSLFSIFTVFEMGARWGANKPLVPLLAPGMSPRDLEAPLSQLNALSSDNRSHIHQLVQELAGHLGIQAESPAVYETKLDRLLQSMSEVPVQEGSLHGESDLPRHPDTLKKQVEPIISDELERLSSAFRASVSNAVAELGATGNRYSTALVHRLEGLGVAELERRSDVLVNTWRRALSRLGSNARPDLLKAVADSSIEQLSTQRQEIESVVNAVDMRRVPRDFDFLGSAFTRCVSRMRAELEILS
jgi:hypothetical protein